MKIFEGIVISIGMNKTAVVEVSRKTPHTLYRKLIKRSKKFKVDNRGFEEAGVGTSVQITETRPISKRKYFKITGIIGSAKSESKPLNFKEDSLEASERVEKPKKTVRKPATTASNAASRSLAKTKKRTRASSTKTKNKKEEVSK